MFKVKRLNIFMLKTFMPMFLMTFFICLFILILFFCYKYITDMVGKGLSIGVLGELFMHVGITFIPTALPLAILLASLMTFGNLGEHLELTALKSSGISLINAMKPLMAFIILVAIGAFFFQNYIIPQSQVKMWTLLFSARQKSLTLDITEGTINSQIPGYNVYVKHKDKETETLHNLLIYDVTPQGGYPRIVTADSGRLSMTDDMKHLVLHLHHGEWYEELNPGGGNNSQLGGESYRRESYTEKKILIPYDATFTRMDDNTMKSQYVGKNIAQLQHTIDSVQLRVDSVGDILSREMRTQVLCGVPVNRIEYHNNHQVYVPVEPVKMAAPIDVDSLFDSMTPQARQLMTSQALMIATSNKQNVEFKSFVVKDDNFTIRRHMIELQRKFTLSLACLIFFFIGAPLGAIIRKGGLGMPIVISVLLFIVYYIIDNTGYKLAREGRWQVWQGIWLSSAILLPFGIFLTHKAVNDSAVFNIESYSSIFKRLLGFKRQRSLSLKEVVIDNIELDWVDSQIEKIGNNIVEIKTECNNTNGYRNYFTKSNIGGRVQELGQDLDDLASHLSNSRDTKVIDKLNELPVVSKPRLCWLESHDKLSKVAAVVVPIGVIVYLFGRFTRSRLIKDLDKTSVVISELKRLV